MRSTVIALLACLVAGIAAATVAGCGSGDDPETIATAPEPAAAGGDRQPDKAKGGGDGTGEKGGGDPGAGAADAAALSAELDQLGERLGARVGATIAPPGAPPLVLGSLQSGSAWSTIKVPIALQVIDEAGGVSSLSGAQISNIQAAISRSDNDAAAALFDDLASSDGSIESASAAVTDLLRKAGDSKTDVSTQGRDGFSSYGQTEWTLEAQQTFMSALLNGCIGQADARKYVLAQMSAVTSDTWGLGSAGVAALWKGGWGPGTDGKYLVRQMGQIVVDDTKYAVTIAAIPDDGVFETGQGVASQVAQFLVDNAPGGRPGGC